MGFKLFTETIQIKQKKNYFAIKNGILYQYEYERARTSLKQITIRETKAIQRSEKNPQEFFIIHKKKCYKFVSESEGICLKWVNSLKYVLENDEEHLDINRYEK